MCSGGGVGRSGLVWAGFDFFWAAMGLALLIGCAKFSDLDL